MCFFYIRICEITVKTYRRKSILVSAKESNIGTIFETEIKVDAYFQVEEIYPLNRSTR